MRARNENQLQVSKKEERLAISSGNIFEPALLAVVAQGLERPYRSRSCWRSGLATPRSASRLSAASSVEARLRESEPVSETAGLVGRRGPEEAAGEGCAACHAAWLDRKPASKAERRA